MRKQVTKQHGRSCPFYMTQCEKGLFFTEIRRKGFGEISTSLNTGAPLGRRVSFGELNGAVSLLASYDSRFLQAAGADGHTCR